MTSAVSTVRARPQGRAALAVLAAVAVLLGLVPPAAAQQQPLEVQRLAGPSRTHTAAAVSRSSHPDGAEVVLLARADAYGDALAGAPLAAVLDAPVLLTGVDALDGAAAEELTRLAPQRVVLLGDLGPMVAGEVLDLGVDQVERIRAEDGWTTWAAIAAEVVALTGADRALLVEGANDDPQRGWPDALSASAWAAADRIPVLLTTAGSLPAATAGAIADAGLSQVTIVGGTAAVSEAVAAEVAGMVGDVDRVAGGSRYDTAVAVATRNLDEHGYTGSVWVASGRGWPDALVAGPAAARAGGVLLLADPASLAHSPQTAGFIDGQRGFAASAHLVGGSAVLSADVEEAVRTGVIPPVGAPTPSPTTDPIGDMPPPVVARNPAPPIEGALPWSDPATWGGQLPQAGEVVTIPADRAVLLDVEPPALRGITIDGTLAVADRDMTIRTGWIVVNGRLAVGTEAAPLTRDVVIEVDPQPGDQVAGAGEGPIAVQGGTLDLHGQVPTHTWTRLASTAVVGSTTLSLQEAPGWGVGDQVVIAATGLDADQAEVRTVTAVSGTTVTVDQPLTHTHWGQVDTLGGAEVAQQAEVGSLTRNVVVRTSPAGRARGVGAHIMVFEGSVAHLSGVELDGMGQTNRVGRYPMHFHVGANMSGSYVRGASIHHTFNRCLTIHASNHVMVRDTIGYESTGHCFFLEDGVEVGNQLICNLGLSTRRPEEGLALLESDRQPATYWISNPSNHLVENAAAGSDGHGFWYDLPAAPTGLSAGIDLDPRTQPFGTFRDNVAHTSSGEGWKQGIGLFVEDYEPPTPAVFEGFHGWKNASFGVWAEGADLTGAVLAENSIGFLGLDSSLRDATVVGATSNAGDRPWRMTGVGFYHGESVISDVTFVNFAEREHPWQHPRVALEFISENNNQVSSVSGATFVNAAPMTITQPDGDDGPDLRSAAVRDVDGSVSGAPALLTSAHPLMLDGGCTWRADLRAHACPVAYDRTWTLVRDLGGGSLGGAWLRRADGVEGALDTDDEPSRGHVDLLIDRAYRLRTGNPLSGHVELIMAGVTEGHLDVSIPWPHPEAHVYDGWGRWQEAPQVGSLASAEDVGWTFDAAAGVLHVRHTLDDLAEKGTWQRLEICAARYCGSAGPG